MSDSKAYKKFKIYLKAIIVFSLLVWTTYFFTLLSHDVKFLTGNIVCFPSDEVPENLKSEEKTP